MTDLPSASPRGYRLGEHALEFARRRLVGPDGAAVPLSGRAYDVLVYLVEHRDRVVSKDELMKSVWPNVIVEENNLNQAISAARKALGDSRESPRHIVTVAGRGYRYIGNVVPLAETQEAPAAPGPAAPAREPNAARRWLLGGAAAIAIVGTTGAWWLQSRRRRVPRSIAVLPFRPLLPDAANPAIELGVTELLINRLSRVPGLVVAPLSSVARYADRNAEPLAAGRALGVDAVVEGHIQVQEQRVRLTARLLDVGDGASLWSNAFTEQLGGLLQVQESLAVQLASALTPELSEDARSRIAGHVTTDVEAWQRYASGRFQFERREESSVRRAVGQFEAALDRDPRFALAAAGLSDAHALLAVIGVEPTALSWQRAQQAAVRAVRLDPQLAAAHTAVGHVVTQLERDLPGGRRHYQRALGIDPANAWSHALMALNQVQASQLDAAGESIRRARQIEPAAFGFTALAAWVSYFQRKFDDAERELARMVDAAPDAAFPRHFLAHVLLAGKRGAEVLRLIDGRNQPSPVTFSNFGRALAQSGQQEAARAEIRRLDTLARQGYGVGFYQALIHVDLGERDLALVALERGVSDHSQTQGYLNVEPALDPLRGEPRFREVARRLDLR